LFENITDAILAGTTQSYPASSGVQSAANACAAYTSSFGQYDTFALQLDSTQTEYECFFQPSNINEEACTTTNAAIYMVD